MQPKILVFAGSLRRGSFNRRLAALVAGELEAGGALVTRLDLADFELPLYHQDLQAEGFPPGAMALHEFFRTHDGVFVANPEYNASVTPMMANIVAWVSRITADGGHAAAFGHPVFALGSASPGPFGGYRGLMALRQMLELGLAARVTPQMVSVGAAHEAFDAEGKLIAARTNGMLQATVKRLIEAASQDVRS